MRVLTHLTTLFVFVFLTGLATAQVYFPLDDGLIWNYVDGAGAELESRVLGPIEYNGLTTVEMQYVQTGANAQEYHNFWTQGDDGVTWLHGAWNADGFSATYDPPILYIESPLYLGLVWTTEFGYNGEIYEMTYEVLEEGDTTVPMGVLYAYGIGGPSRSRLPVAGGHADHDPLGRRLTDQSRSTDRWLTENIGLIRDESGFELVSFYGSVAVASTTWTAVKALFVD